VAHNQRLEPTPPSAARLSRNSLGACEINMTTILIAAKIIGSLLLFLLIYQVVVRVLAKTLRKYIAVPAPSFLGVVLDSRLRRKIQPPVDVILRSGVKEGMQVVDLGCGSGTFTLPMARVVGEMGKVFAVDVQPKMLRQLESKLSRDENQLLRGRVRVIEGSAYRLPFEDESIDVCCMVSVLQEIPDRIRALREVKRILKPDGILAVSEFVIDPDYAFPSTTIALGKQGGFAVDEVCGSFWNYTVRFRKR